ncbi:hypothetical protein U9M48_026192 [Paspalum notatum var. saurae]|uniref:Uncharacterized protein n=1 Tax=Paspalum notatum var. saurae TaxID=547442 RepID=A0AAQ3TRV2_PASNO
MAACPGSPDLAAGAERRPPTPRPGAAARRSARRAPQPPGRHHRPDAAGLAVERELAAAVAAQPCL